MPEVQIPTEVQIPVYNAPERGLTDREIEGLTEQDHFDLWEKEIAGPPTYIYSEVETTPRETVKAPIITASETLSYGQQLQESINHTPEKELIVGIGQTGSNIVAMRRMITQPVAQPQPTRSDYALGA